MISFVPTGEQALMKDTIVSYVERRAPVDRLRAGDAGAGHDENRIVADLAEFGLFSMALPEPSGGLGLTSVEEVLVHREIGRALVTTRCIATAIACHVADRAGNQACVGDIIEGNTSAAFVLPNGNPDEDNAVYALDRRPGDLLLLLAKDKVTLLGEDALEDVRSVPSIDTAMSLEHGRIRQGADEAASQADDELRDRLLLLVAAQASGIAQAACDLAADYARVREQFGQPIGRFQGVAHQCSDMALRARAAETQTTLAAIFDRDRHADRRFQLLSAAIVAIDAAQRNSSACIQVHGGFGFTADCHAHRYLKRAVVCDRLAGGLQLLRREMVAQPSAI